MIDTHCHLDVPAFAGDRDEVIARASAAGVSLIVVPAIRPSTWPGLLALRTPMIRVALGIHPQVVPDLREEELRALDHLGEHEIVAVGECGLDGATGAQDEQERIFRRQIAVARNLKKPLLVHVLKAHDAAAKILAEEHAEDVGGIMHSFSGGPELVPRYRDLGFAFSFAGPVTYTNARRPVAAARAVPEELLLAETDAPDQTPVPHRGQRCEPAFLVEVVKGLAAARSASIADTAALVTGNARRVLALP